MKLYLKQTILIFFRPNLSKKDISGLKKITLASNSVYSEKSSYEILAHASNFNSLDHVYQKGYFPFAVENVNNTIEFNIFELVSVASFIKTVTKFVHKSGCYLNYLT